MTHDQVQDLLADFALELLDEGEEREVRAHLDTCPDCRHDLQPYLQAGEALALAPEETPMPAGAAERIEAGVRDRIRLQGAPPREMRGAGGGGGSLVMGPWRSIALGAAAAVLLLAVGLTGVTIAWLDARDDVGRLEGQLAARAIELPLSGEGASGTIYVASDFKSGVARFVGLEPAPAQHHYQVWSEGPDGAKSAADFVGGTNGELLVRLPELPKTMTRMFVTIEPDGATGDRPTGPEVMSTPK